MPPRLQRAEIANEKTIQRPTVLGGSLRSEDSVAGIQFAVDGLGGEAHAGEQLRDVRIPDAVRAPCPAARILRWRGLLVPVEPREIDVLLVAVPRRQCAPVRHRKGLSERHGMRSSAVQPRRGPCCR